MSLQRLIENLEADFRRVNYKKAQENAGELGEQIENLVSCMITHEYGSEKRHQYQQLIFNCLEEMSQGTVVGIYQLQTLTIYKVLYKYGISHE